MKKAAAVLLLIVTFALMCGCGNEEKMPIGYEVVTDAHTLAEVDSRTDDEVVGNGESCEVIERGNDYYLVVHWGEEPHYYSRLEVVDIKADGDGIEVTVELPDGEGMGDAFSYPKAVIKLDRVPGSVKVTKNRR